MRDLVPDITDNQRQWLGQFWSGCERFVPQLTNSARRSAVAQVLLNQMVTMLRELRCGDVFEGCSYVEQGSDIRELMQNFMAHLREAHHVATLTPELRIQAMVAVRQARPNVD